VTEKRIERNEIEDEVKSTKRYKMLKRFAILDASFWLVMAGLYLYLHNWVALVLVAVILIKIHTAFMNDRTFLYMSKLLDELLSTIKDIITDEPSDTKEKK
jgi:uncharacterized membrane protein YccF (DUF307 family)